MGEILGVIGSHRFGSTLIQHFNGLLKPVLGEVLLDGQPIWNEKGQMRAKPVSASARYSSIRNTSFSRRRSPRISLTARPT